MKKLIFIILSLMMFTSYGQQKEWQLVWSDEFNQDGMPDTLKWNYDVGYIANNEKQYYVPHRAENARIENGNLVIEAHKEEWEGFAYTSARLKTQGKHSWTYGRFEVRAKVPTGRGTWPAIWMLGTNINRVGWPTCGEIDIMEHVGYDPIHVHANIHTKAYNHAIGTNKGGTITLEKPWEEYHVYAVEWFEDHMDFYVDDVKYFTFEKETDTDPARWPFNQPQFLILNLAIGGGWGGQQGIDDTLFPHKFYVDYVRVYQLK